VRLEIPPLSAFLIFKGRQSEAPPEQKRRSDASFALANCGLRFLVWHKISTVKIVFAFKGRVKSTTRTKASL
jgi:hypothetical protein